MIKDILKKLREQNGIKQKEIAKILNMSLTGYASWEQGKSEPNIDNIKKICAFYKISTDELLEFDGD